LKSASKNEYTLKGNILKLIDADPSDEVFAEYIKVSVEKDHESRRRRLDVTKQIQERNRELLETEDELKVALEEAQAAREDAEKAKDLALNDLDIIQKKSQFELMGSIVRVALFVIVGVGITSTAMYGIALFSGTDTQIIGSTWSNMLGILLTNAFSIVGTIMGVKYASEKSNKE
jgi:hypothetical protein